MKSLTVFFFSVIVVIVCTAQQSYPDSLKPQMVKDWEPAWSYTLKFLEATPAEKYNWKPTKEIRSSAQQWLYVRCRPFYNG